MILAIAVGLSMDAFAVSVSNGLSMKQMRVRHSLRLSLSFGFFQAIMPVLGWCAGRTFASFIDAVDGWIAFGLLAFVGGKMIYESFALDGEEEEEKDVFVGVRELLILSLATSIDAFAVGVSFSILKVAILLPCIIIGVVTFLLCFVGVLIGQKIGHFFEKKIEIIGGLILIAIGIRILVLHLAG